MAILRIFIALQIWLLFWAPLSAQVWIPSAAGRIENIENPMTCSAYLLRQDLVVTAAHCVQTGQKKYRFRPAEANFGSQTVLINQVLRHPRYVLGGSGFARQRYDIAIGVLEAPVPTKRRQSVKIGGPARIGEILQIESWRPTDGVSPKRRPCRVIAGVDAFQVTLACAVRGGESGAPVLRLGEGGPELVAIVTARARHQGQDVALAALIEHHSVLLEALAQSE